MTMMMMMMMMVMYGDENGDENGDMPYKEIFNIESWNWQ